MTQSTKLSIFLFFVFSLIYGCNNQKYQINKNGIKGVSLNDGFTIAELKDGKSSEEVLRVCCEPVSHTELKRQLYFKKKNVGYHWNFCTLDLRFVENDSLKNLSLEEKLEILRREGHIGSPEHFDTIPINFKVGTWYHIFGLEDIEGSFYFYVEKDGAFKVEYFDGGPW